MTKPEQLVDPWTIAKDISTWLPSKDHERAMRIIDHHERQHIAAANLELIERAERPPGEAHEAGMPMRFDNLARLTDSRWVIRPAGLRQLWPVSRIPRLVRQACWTKRPVFDMIPAWRKNEL
ncbi:hypothetical protein CA54_52790 [Symmachiella macrocystis]|uniref:Uncharacterized protein n=1 Tax=Symmachiella macrocystis TaxID=2527985 RepID=A0A5C6B552_9PLAN|nr:hypothetical protein [Symmachiella macrocystis]TWU06877.1 hypothetical protein CA54_52790 [Symmachiella macrocystis]